MKPRDGLLIKIEALRRISCYGQEADTDHKSLVARKGFVIGVLNFFSPRGGESLPALEEAYYIYGEADKAGYDIS